MCVKCLENADLWRQITISGCLGLGEEKEMEYKSFGGDGNVLKLACGSGCRILSLLKNC